MPQRIIDTHVHTDNSPDGHHSAMYMCECAEMAGLRAIAFTDHVESDAYRRDHYDRVALQSFIDVTKARGVSREAARLRGRGARSADVRCRDLGGDTRESAL